MPFIPHTEEDRKAMLAELGESDLEALFDEVPAELRADALESIPAGLSEMAISRHMQSLAETDPPLLNFVGAGAYEHHIPAAVWQLAGRGEFYTAYTPYQAEASQGTLQVIYEYQSMMAGLTGMEVSNASLYDGASALAEAVLMAVRGNRKAKRKRILMPASVHPAYRATVHAIVHNQGIELVEVPFDATTGRTTLAALEAHAGEDFAALVVPQPNFFGVLEEVDELTRWAHEQQQYVIGLVNPTSLALLKPPGEWGDDGADIVCGDGQPLGAPLSFGGPYYGFMCCRQAHVRQMPGRIVGRATDADGKPGFVLTLQAREQHIRRSRATSNICTNQGLVVTASTIYMALLGEDGLRSVAAQCHANTHKLVESVRALGIEPLFASDFFHEVVLRLDRPVQPVLDSMANQGVLGGYALEKDYPSLSNCLLVCATEMRSDEDVETFTHALNTALSREE